MIACLVVDDCALSCMLLFAEMRSVFGKTGKMKAELFALSPFKGRIATAQFTDPGPLMRKHFRTP